MRLFFGIGVVVLFACGVLAWRQPQPPDTFGSFEGASVEPLNEVVWRPADYTGRRILLEGEVRRECHGADCSYWFVANGRAMRVAVDRIAPLVPERGEKRARVEGQVARTGSTYEIVANALEFL